jgi:hypothetical protein
MESKPNLSSGSPTSASTKSADTSEQYVVVVSPVPIRSTATPGAEVIGQAVKGDVYELYKEMPSDYSIFLFEGDERFIRKNAARMVPFVKPTLSEEVKRQAFLRFARAEDRSFREADARVSPTEVRRNVALQRLLDDRYKLEIVHQLKIPPAMYDDIVAEGVKMHWPFKNR